MSMLAPIFFSLSAIDNTKSNITKLLLFGLFILCFCAFGDTFDYYCGRFAKKLLNKSSYFKQFLKHPHIQKCTLIFEKYGSIFVILVSCIPILHSTCSYIAGSTKYSFKKFILSNTFANVCIILSCFLLGHLLGHIPFVKRHLFLIISVCLTSFFVIVFSISYMLQNKKTN